MNIKKDREIQVKHFKISVPVTWNFKIYKTGQENLNLDIKYYHKTKHAHSA